MKVLIFKNREDKIKEFQKRIPYFEKIIKHNIEGYLEFQQMI
jgi:hypothetical protein